MGIDSEIVAIGPFSPDLVTFLQHPAARYESLPTGTQVITLFIHAPTSDTSHALAAACGFKAWSFDRHHIEPEKVDLEALRIVGNESGVADLDDAFRRFWKAEFDFYFITNG